MKTPSRARPTLRRRDVFRLATLAPVAAVLATGCASAQSGEPDPLTALDTAAREDAVLARAVANAHPDLSEAAAAIAETRAEHARALRREIDRVNPPDPDQPGPPEPSTPQAPGSAAEAIEALNEALRRAHQETARLTPALPTYRAGLVGSVSASCACLLEVLA